MNRIIEDMKRMKTFLLLWLTQSFSQLGSEMTSYALVIWSYTQKGSALMTALLMVCSYAPYVLLSVFAGALIDKWNKKITMLVSDLFAAITTVIVLVLIELDCLELWHLLIINSLNGLMNTVQQPASEVVVSRVLPKDCYQKVGGLRYCSNSVINIVKPMLASAIMGMLGIRFVFAFDLVTFVVAFLALAFLIRVPKEKEARKNTGSLLATAKSGVTYLKQQRGIFDLILFLAAINFIASCHNAAFPAMALSRNGGSQTVYGVVNTVIGVTTLLGGIVASLAKKPKSRVRVICNCLLFSMSFDNFFLAFGKKPAIWCIGGFLGWIFIPMMSTNLDALLRLNIPEEMQGRVYAVRNSFQFFTIPIGMLLGGFLVDKVFEPFMALQHKPGILTWLYGTGKGSGAAILFSVLGITGITVCLCFRKDKHLWCLEQKNS